MLRRVVSSSLSTVHRSFHTALRCSAVEFRRDPEASDKDAPTYRGSMGIPLYLGDKKEATGLVGVDPIPDGRQVLIDTYIKTLHAVQDIPETAEYRLEVERFTHQRLGVLMDKELTDLECEIKIKKGQIEELYLVAKDELALVEKMKEWKPWEVPEGTEAPELLYVSPLNGRWNRGGSMWKKYADGEPVKGAGQRMFD